MSLLIHKNQIDQYLLIISFKRMKVKKVFNKMLGLLGIEKIVEVNKIILYFNKHKIYPLQMTNTMKIRIQTHLLKK